MNKQLVLILDASSDLAVQCARRVRAQGVYCEVLPANAGSGKIEELAPSGVIVLPGCAYDDGAPVHYYDPADEDALKSFLSGTLGSGEWSMKGYAEEYIAQVREKVGNKKVLLALSGGVDSSVCAALLSKAIGKQLTCLYVDTGLMRKGESDEIERIFTKQFDLNFRRADAESRFLDKLKGVTDPEQKRRIVGEEFIRVFEDEAAVLGAMDFLAQGTIYPDVVESGVGGKAVVKSHHNVGGLPESIGFAGILEPLRSLFKEEVRALGRELGLPESLTERQPFPGPGLSVRVLGEVTKDKLDILREADAIFTSELETYGKLATQYFAVLTSMRSVGVSNSERTYDYTVALRAVSTSDFMEADWVELPYPLLRKVSARIVSEVPHINRVLYDITAKPPATIEYE